MNLCRIHKSILGFDYFGQLMCCSENLQSIEYLEIGEYLSNCLKVIFGEKFCKEKEYIECLNYVVNKDSRLIIEKIIIEDNIFAIAQLVKA